MCAATDGTKQTLNLLWWLPRSPFMKRRKGKIIYGEHGYCTVLGIFYTPFGLNIKPCTYIVQQ